MAAHPVALNIQMGRRRFSQFLHWQDINQYVRRRLAHQRPEDTEARTYGIRISTIMTKLEPLVILSMASYIAPHLSRILSSIIPFTYLRLILSTWIFERPMSLEALVRQRRPVDISHKVTSVANLPVYSGGFGQIRKGHMHGELVAVKFLMEPTRGHPSKRRATMERRVRRELTVWAVLKHPNIAKFEGYVTGIAEFPAMVSKWCKNKDAATYLEVNTSIPLKKRICLGLDVANGLKYLHSLKIVHGDLKPQNVLISDEGVAQLCDFGLARLVDWKGKSGLTTTTPYGGTPLYRAHELWRSRRNPNPRPTFASDIYALGCVLYEFAYQRRPFGDILGEIELAEAIQAGDLPATRPQGLNTEEGQLWDLFEQCWKPEPLERTTAEAVVYRLHTIIGTT